MLLNLSNHPYTNWPLKQQTAAIEQFGVVQDLDFPLVDPEATSDEVDLLAEQYLHTIRQFDPVAVHLMGELTFCFKLTNLLSNMGYRVIASTTARKVTFDADGKKISTFDFIRFRDY